MAQSGGIADVVIFTMREDLRRNIESAVKMKGAHNVLVPDKADETIDSLDRFPKALLIIDWECGAEEVVKVLTHNRKRYAELFRPILLITPAMSNQIIATAAEYFVTQVFSEDPSPRNLTARLAGLMMGETMPRDMKTTLAAIYQARKEGDHGKTGQLLVKALKKYPGNIRLKCETAESLMQAGEWEKALSVLDGVTEIRPVNVRAIHLLGRCLMRLGRNDEAMKAFEVANVFNPHDVDRLIDIGELLLNLDRSDEARENFDKAMTMDPSSKEARFGASKCDLLDGQVNDALALLNGVASPQEMASVFNISAVLSMRHGRHDAGMNLYQSALKAIGANNKIQARLYFNMGMGHRRSGNKIKAKECYEMSTRLDPEFAKVREHLVTVVVEPTPAAGPVSTDTIEPRKGKVSTGDFDFSADMTSFFDDEELQEESLLSTKKGA